MADVFVITFKQTQSSAECNSENQMAGVLGLSAGSLQATLGRQHLCHSWLNFTDVGDVGFTD